MLYIILFYENKNRKCDNKELTETYKSHLTPFKAHPNDLCKKGMAYILRMRIGEYYTHLKNKLWKPSIDEVILKKEDNLNLHNNEIGIYWSGYKCYLLYTKSYSEQNFMLNEYNDLLFPVCPYDKKPIYPYDESYKRKLKCEHVYHKKCAIQMILKATDDFVLLTERQAKTFKVILSACAENGCSEFTEDEVRIIFGKQIKTYEVKRERTKESERDAYTLRCCNKQISKREYGGILKGAIYLFNKGNILYNRIESKSKYVKCVYCGEELDETTLRNVLGDEKFEEIAKVTCCHCNKRIKGEKEMYQVLACKHEICSKCLANVITEFEDLPFADPHYPAFYCYICENAKNLEQIIIEKNCVIDFITLLITIYSGACASIKTGSGLPKLGIG